MNELGSKLLKEVINSIYNNIKLDNISFDDNEFYYEFKADEQVSENEYTMKVMPTMK